jgi:hypothetical protein
VRTLIAVLLCLPGLASAEGLIERDKVDIAPAPGVRIHTLKLDNRLGDVTVVGTDRPSISLSVIKRAPDDETLDRLKVNLVPDPSGTVTITSALLFGEESRPVGAGQVRIDIRVEAPRGAKVSVQAWNGRVSVTEMTSGANLAGHETEMTVANVKGLITTTNVRGRQQLTDLDGDVSANNTYGELNLDGIEGGTLAARVHDGTVIAQRIRSRNVKIITTFGHIRFRGELLAGVDYDLRSYRGNVEVLATGNFSVDAYSRDGAVDSRVELAEVARPEAGRLMGTYGSRQRPATLHLSSTAGNVIVGLMNE